MTIREFYIEAMNCNALSEDARTIARNFVEKDAEKRDAKAAENATLTAQVVEILKNASEPVKCADVAAALGIHTSKATYILKAIEGVKIDETIEKGRVVKTYAL